MEILLHLIFVGLVINVSKCQFSYKDTYEEDEENGDYDKNMRALIRQMIMQQLYLEEKTRGEGDSGVKQVRGNLIGTKSYYADSMTGNSGFLSIHNHANNVRTIGLGEFSAVLNGVEFRTRHNDYQLVMPVTDDTTYHKTEPIPFPPVPESVLEKETLDEQIKEMRLYFQSFHNQEGPRDWKPYFKPIMCYLEGAWTESAMDIDESFPSDRHWLDAYTWHEMHEKMRFNGYSGAKEGNENQAYLPTTIIGLNGSTPIIAQWNYRIVCHPLKDDLPLNRFRIIDDLQARMRERLTIEDYEHSRFARFQLNQRTGNNWEEGIVRPQTLDIMFEEIPGYDNYGADLKDEAYGMKSYSIFDGSRELNAAYYHRFWRSSVPDAMGLGIRSRGFSDENLYVAMNSQEKIPGMTLTDCDRQIMWYSTYTTPPSTPETGYHTHKFTVSSGQMDLLYGGQQFIWAFTDEEPGHGHHIRLSPVWDDDHEEIIRLFISDCKPIDEGEWEPECPDGHTGEFDVEDLTVIEECDTYHQKMSYAIPLEIVYLTPLSTWNPYNLTNWEGDNGKPIESGRDGNKPETALNGISNIRYYQTPAEFYTGEDIDDDPADTSGGDVWVEDPNGVPRAVRASGHYIFLPNIEGVGSIRQRYPIAPLHEEGNSLSKEVEALKEILLKPVTYQHLFHEDLSGIGVPPTEPPPTVFNYYTAPSRVQQEFHLHRFPVTVEQWDRLLGGQPTITCVTWEFMGHSHTIRLNPIWNEDHTDIIGLTLGGCLNEASGDYEDECWDGHGGDATEADD